MSYLEVKSTLGLKSKAEGQPWAGPLSPLGPCVGFSPWRVEGPAGVWLRGGDEATVEGWSGSSALQVVWNVDLVLGRPGLE